MAGAGGETKAWLPDPVRVVVAGRSQCVQVHVIPQPLPFLLSAGAIVAIGLSSNTAEMVVQGEWRVPLRCLGGALGCLVKLG